MVAPIHTLSEVPKPRVLLVEDDRRLSSLLAHLLREDYEIHPVETAEAADCFLRDREIDLVICDHGLPGENGLPFLTRLSRERPGVPRILLTGNQDQEVIIQAINEGEVHRYLRKPAELEDIREAVDSALTERDERLAMERTAEELREAQAKLASPSPLARRVREFSAEAWRFMFKAMLMYAVGSIGFLIFGLGILLVMYLVKTVAGLDFLSINLDELLRRFHDWALSLL